LAARHGPLSFRTEMLGGGNAKETFVVRPG